MKKLRALLLILCTPLLLLGIYYWIGYSREENILIGEHVRRVRVHKPLDLKPNSPAVILLHGYGDFPRMMETYSGFSFLADKEGFLVVYPYGTNSEVDKSLSWNAGFCCGTALFNLVNDVNFLQELKSYLVKKYEVDPNKIYLAGFSNGALLTLKIAAEKPEMFAAYGAMAVSVGGQGLGSDCWVYFPKPKIAPRVIMIHGTNDPAVPYEGGPGKYRKTLPAPLSVLSFEKSKNFWIGSGADFKWLVSKDRGHIWLGGLMEQITYGEVGKIDTTSEFWRFFNER